MDFPQFQSTLQVGTGSQSWTGYSLQSLQGSVDGTYVFVGSPSNPTGFTAAGAFGIFKRAPRTLNFVSLGIYQASDRAVNNQFGYSIAVNSNAEYMVIGAPFATRSANLSGTAYLYKKNPTTDFWQVLYQFQASDLLASDYFGLGTAMTYSGEYMAVAAPGKNIGAINDAGYVYVYKKQPTTDFWNFLQRLEMINPVTNSALGTNLQFTWDGSYLMASVSPSLGSATLVFKKDSTTDSWSEITRFTGISTTGGFARFSISSNGDYVYRPIFYNSTCVFKKQAGTDYWNLQQYIYSPAEIANDGIAISSSGSNLLTGSGSWPSVAESSGAATYFKKSASTDRWDYVSTLRVPIVTNVRSQFGRQISFIGDGSFALISAPLQSTVGGGGSAVGVVYSYSFSEAKQIPTSAEYVIANVPQSGRGLYILPQVVSTQSQSLFFRAAPSNVQVQYLRFSTLAGDLIDFQSTISSVGYDTSYQFFNDRASNWYTLASSGTPF